MRAKDYRVHDAKLCASCAEVPRIMEMEAAYEAQLARRTGSRPARSAPPAVAPTPEAIRAENLRRIARENQYEMSAAVRRNRRQTKFTNRRS